MAKDKEQKKAPAKTEKKVETKKAPKKAEPVKEKKVVKKVEKVTEKKSRKTPAALPAGVKASTDKSAEKKTTQKKTPGKIKVAAIKRPRQFHVGGSLPPKRDLSRMVRWPAYIRLQRQKKIMYQRLKIPAMINQFTQTLDKHSAKQVFKMVKKYRPETQHQKKKRLLALANAKKHNNPITITKPFVVKFGVNHVTSLIEQKKAKLVVIANDVDPIETVLWMPTLCRKLDIPYCIVKNKARLGTAVHLKTATCMAFVNVREEDKKQFDTLVSMCKANYNERADQIVKAIGGGKLGQRSSMALKKRADALKKASLEKQAF